MTPEARLHAFRALAATLDRIDREVYEALGRDPLEPVMGEGDRRARVCFMGRDPGRHEVEYRQPFVGVGGQKLRVGLYEHLHGEPMPDFQASLDVGAYVFWANTVPYKPVGNKVWSAKVRKAFAPYVRDLLVHGWEGTDVVVLGRVAFDWFGHDKPTKERLQAHWNSPERFESSVQVVVTAPDGASRALRIHPQPHPSPLNATWAPHVPRLLSACLHRIGLSTDDWRV